MKSINLEIYKSGDGWKEEVFKVKETFTVRQPRGPKVYEVWEDSEGNQYWALLTQKVNSAIEADKSWVEKILDYTQQDNWIIETYTFNSRCCLTKYYPDYYPNVINEGSADLYSHESYRQRVISHYAHFDNPYKEDYFKNVNGVEKIEVSQGAPHNRQKFYREAIHQHELFSDNTGCYFADIDPNNFLVDENFNDIKIIDVCCITPGDIRDYNDGSDPRSSRWPLKEHRIVGPVWSDTYYKDAYNI